MKPLQILIRDRLAPVLRSRGFKRSSGSFRAVTDRGAALIAISGRGSTGTYDIECTVDVGFAPTTYFEAAQVLHPERTTTKFDITATYGTFHTRMRDPGLTPMDDNATWRFNLDDTPMVELMTTVLTMAADDVLTRLELWPEVPADSLSRNPVFSVPVEWETRSRWRSNPGGEIDLHFAATAPVVRRRGWVGSVEFEFDLLHDDQAGAIAGGMIQIDPEVVSVLTGNRTMAEWAQSVGLFSMAGHSSVPLTPPPSSVQLVERAGQCTLLIDGETGHPSARLDLGPFILLPDRARQEQRVQVIIVAGDRDCLQQLTFQTRVQLANAGRVWWGTVPITQVDS